MVVVEICVILQCVEMGHTGRAFGWRASEYAVVDFGSYYFVTPKLPARITSSRYRITLFRAPPPPTLPRTHHSTVVLTLLRTVDIPSSVFLLFRTLSQLPSFLIFFLLLVTCIVALARQAVTEP